MAKLYRSAAGPPANVVPNRDKIATRRNEKLDERIGTRLVRPADLVPARGGVS